VLAIGVVTVIDVPPVDGFSDTATTVAGLMTVLPA
jgi:hypothetical protein